MKRITRRQSLTMGAGLIAAATATRGAFGAPQVAEVPPLRLPIESGARLRVLRPAKYIDPDEAIFTANSRRFTEQTGVEVRVDYVAWPDMPVQTAVAANTSAGPDVIVGFGADPHIFTDKIIEVTEVANYLGARYGGWYDLAKLYGRKWQSDQWLSIPMGGTTGPVVYRISWVKEAGFDAIPNDLQDFLKLCQNLKKNGHPCGFTLAHAPGDAPNYANWLLWSHGAALVDEQGRVTIDSAETRKALDYARELQVAMAPGTMSWNGASNNQLFVSGSIGLTQNGVSIYYSLKTSNDPKQQAIAADTDHAPMPFGAATQPPESVLTLNAMIMKYSRFPNAAKAYLSFMMEAPQYDPWLTGCLGYWSQPLKAYAASDVWDKDPKLDVFRTAMDTVFHDGYKGPVNAAAGSVMSDWVLVDMFARVVAGEVTPNDAIRQAERSARRYYKG
jgi:multiple sugar transport system substrate-binding protein